MLYVYYKVIDNLFYLFLIVFSLAMPMHIGVICDTFCGRMLTEGSHTLSKIFFLYTHIFIINFVMVSLSLRYRILRLAISHHITCNQWEQPGPTIHIIPSSSTSYQCSFFLWIIMEWNTLPLNIIETSLKLWHIYISTTTLLLYDSFFPEHTSWADCSV